MGAVLTHQSPQPPVAKDTAILFLCLSALEKFHTRDVHNVWHPENLVRKMRQQCCAVAGVGGGALSRGVRGGDKIALN